MKRVCAIVFLIIMCIGLLAMPVLAATSAQAVNASATMVGDASYVMDLQVQIKLDQVLERIPFPIPLNADEVTLFGSRPSTDRARGALQVNIPADYLGGMVSIHYRAQADVALSKREGYLEVDIPLLNGFQYPVEAMRFSVTLPGELQPGTDPAKFLSNTHGQMIESYLTFTAQGQTVTGELTRPLKDGASLILHLILPREMFPHVELETWSVSFDDYAMYVLAGVAFVYWLIFLRCLPPRRQRSATAPEGLSAGELGTALIGQGCDLTMMVLSWAQLGYILIHLDGHGRVMLHKRMDMGNERSGFEQRCFRLLFGKQTQVNGTGMHYAQLVHKVAAMKPESRGYYRRRSGSTRIFRAILALVGALAGLSLGMAFAEAVWLQVIACLLLVPAGFASSLLMQGFVKGLHLRGRLQLVLGLGLAGLWLAVSLWLGEPVVGIWMVACQLLGGLAYGYGGMRTEVGRLAMSRILGLRRYFITAPKPELQRILRAQPDYFFTMAPYAAALGVDGSFADRFGGKRLTSCPYLTTGMDGHMAARDWDKLLRRAITALDQRATLLPIDRFLGIFFHR